MTRALLALLLAAGCAGGATHDEALAGVLVELHLLEARHALFGDVPPEVRRAVLARHGFDEASLARALEALDADLPRSREVYGAVADTLEARSRVTAAPADRPLPAGGDAAPPRAP